MDIFQKIESAWGFALPSEFRALYKFSEVDAVKLKNGKVMSLPWPVLRPEEIVQQAVIGGDWEIPLGLIPFMGNMHNIMCLDFRQNEIPSVVFLNDTRESNFLFDSISEFISAITQLPEEPLSSQKVIVEPESWLNF